MADHDTINPEHSPAQGASAVATRPATTPGPTRVDRLPPWRVLLHNDERSEMLEVVKTIQRLTHLPAREAFTRMMEAHTRGVAVLVETHREHAELLVEQFVSCRLRVTAEAAP